MREPRMSGRVWIWSILRFLVRCLVGQCPCKMLSWYRPTGCFGLTLSSEEHAGSSGHSKQCVARAAGFPPHLEKQDQTWKTGGGGWQKPGKILQNLENKLTSPKKSPKASTEEVSEKKSSWSKRSWIFLCLFGQKFGNCWFLLELQKYSSDMKNSFQAWVLRIKNLEYSHHNWSTGYFQIHNQ